MLTACGIETISEDVNSSGISFVATVLTACGIETNNIHLIMMWSLLHVATVLTACGIETKLNTVSIYRSF